MKIEVLHKVEAGIPNTPRVYIDGGEGIEQVLNIHILQLDPPRFFVPRLVITDPNRQPVEVTIPGCA